MNFKQQTNTGRRNKSYIFPHLPWRGCTFSPNNKNPRLLLHQTKYHHFQCSLTKQQKQEGKKIKIKITTILVDPIKKNTRSSTKITLLGTTRHERGRGKGGGR
jgi:hypothetical protein